MGTITSICNNNTSDVSTLESNPISKTNKEENSTFDVNEGAGKSLGKLYDNMDENNKKAADVLVSQGTEKAVEFMFKHPETGEKMDYATMRYYYG